MREKPEEVDKRRAANLRQHLLKTSRLVNAAIVDGLHARGFEALRSTHTALLSNLEMDGSTLTSVAQRAGMTKQAMGRLADELVRLGYVRSCPDENDRRAVSLEFTKSGLDLMRQSFEVMRDIENRCIGRIGKGRYETMLRSLAEISAELERDA